MRLFVAVEFPPLLIEALTAAQQDIRLHAEKGRFKRSENFHLTLKFLGETPPAAIDRLTACLQQAAKQSRPFTLSLGQPGLFGARPPIRTIWLGLSGETEKLQALQQAVETACLTAGFAAEQRPYSPHITLAQAVIPRPGGSCLPQEVPSHSFAVHEFALVQSEEKDRKRVYTPLHCFPLKAGEG